MSANQGRESKKSRPQAMSYSIVPKILLALLLAFGAAMDAVMLLGDGSKQTSDRLKSISDDYLPILTNIVDLLNRTVYFVAQWPDILRSETEHGASTLSAQLAGIGEEKHRLVSKLRLLYERPDDKRVLQALDHNFNTLGEDFQKLVELSLRRWELQRRIGERLERLRQLSGQVARLLRTRGQGPIACLNAWSIHAQQAIAELSLASAGSDSGLSPRSENPYLRAAQAMDENLPCEVENGARALRRLHHEITRADGIRAIVDLRRDHRTLQLQIENKLIDARMATEAMTDSVSEWSAQLHQAIRAGHDEVGSELRDRLSTAAYVPLLLVGIGVAVWSYLSRSLLGPILALRQAMYDHLRGRTPQFPPDGADEIGAITRAVQVFIAELDAREAQLRTAKAEVERVSNSKSLFLARVSHDLRTPLNAILGYTELLRHEPGLGKQARRSFSIIRSSGTHLLDLIDDLLDVAAIDAGRLRPVGSDINLRRLLDELDGSHRVLAQAKGLDFQLQRDSGLPQYIHIDGKRLRQVLGNLISNAIKFTQQGRVLAQVERIETADQAPRLRFSVIDSGPGIAPQHQTLIFEPFQQLSTQFEGAGLGLPISHELVSLLGGTLRLDSRPRHGSRFWFEIPLVKAAERGPAAERPMDDHAGPRRELLVVDDSADMDYPERIELETLLDLLARERWSEIGDWSTDLAAGEPRYRTFAEQVRSLADTRDPIALRSWLEQFRKPR